MKNNCNINIGGLNFRIESDFYFHMPKNVKEFIVKDTIECDVAIKVTSNINFHNEFYDNQIIYIDEEWFTLYEDNLHNYLFNFKYDDSSNVEWVFVSNDRKKIEFYISENHISNNNISIIETTPFLMSFMIVLLNNDGFILHSAGAYLNGDGYAFCGQSGAGKTTLSNILKNNRVRMLTDETLIIRKNELGNFNIYGTPWKGSGDNIYSNFSCNLGRIFIINHGSSNQVERIDSNKAIGILLKQAFPYFWDKRAMLKCFNLINYVANKISIDNLFFLPDQSVFEYIRNLKKK